MVSFQILVAFFHVTSPLCWIVRPVSHCRRLVRSQYPLEEGLQDVETPPFVDYFLNGKPLVVYIFWMFTLGYITIPSIL